MLRQEPGGRACTARSPIFSGRVQLLVVNHCPLAHFANDTTKIYNEIMTEAQKQRLEQQLWNIANELRGKMDADEFRDYILGSIFLQIPIGKTAPPGRSQCHGHRAASTIQPFVRRAARASNWSAGCRRFSATDMSSAFSVGST